MSCFSRRASQPIPMTKMRRLGWAHRRRATCHLRGTHIVSNSTQNKGEVQGAHWLLRTGSHGGWPLHACCSNSPLPQSTDSHPGKTQGCFIHHLGEVGSAMEEVEAWAMKPHHLGWNSTFPMDTVTDLGQVTSDLSKPPFFICKRGTTILPVS